MVGGSSLRNDFAPVEGKGPINSSRLWFRKQTRSPGVPIMGCALFPFLPRNPFNSEAFSDSCFLLPPAVALLEVKHDLLPQDLATLLFCDGE